MKRVLMMALLLTGSYAVAQEEICDEVSLTRPQYKCKKGSAPATTAPEAPIESKVIVKPQDTTPSPKPDVVVVQKCPVCKTCKPCKACPAQRPCPAQQPCPAAQPCPAQQPCPQQPVTNNYYQGQKINGAADAKSYNRFMLSAMVGGVAKPVRVNANDQEKQWLVPAIGAEFTYFPSKDIGLSVGAYTDSFVFGKVGFLFGGPN